MGNLEIGKFSDFERPSQEIGMKEQLIAAWQKAKSGNEDIIKQAGYLTEIQMRERFGKFTFVGLKIIQDEFEDLYLKVAKQLLQDVKEEKDSRKHAYLVSMLLENKDMYEKLGITREELDKLDLKY